jgi:hypothetical protein
LLRKKTKNWLLSLEAEFNVKVVCNACDVSSSEMVEITFKNIIDVWCD